MSWFQVNNLFDTLRSVTSYVALRTCHLNLRMACQMNIRFIFISWFEQIQQGTSYYFTVLWVIYLKHWFNHEQIVLYSNYLSFEGDLTTMNRWNESIFWQYYFMNKKYRKSVWKFIKKILNRNIYHSFNLGNYLIRYSNFFHSPIEIEYN